MDVWYETGQDIIETKELIMGTVKVTEISKKVQERRMQWYGHVMRREEDYVGRRVMRMEVQGRRNRRTPRRRWMDSVNDDLREKNLTEQDTQNRTEWRRLTRNVYPAYTRVNNDVQ